MEDTEGELGTAVGVVVHASGALSRLFVFLDLLLNLLDIFESKFLLSLSSSFSLPAFDIDCFISTLGMLLSNVLIGSFFV